MILIPDVVLDSSSVLESALSNAIPASAVPQAMEAIAASHPTETLEGLTGIIIRVKEIFIIKNGRGFIFDKGANIYPLILVANGMSTNPVEFSLPHMFNHVKDGTSLPITAPGITIQRDFNSMPDFLDIHVLIMSSLEQQREFAKALTDTLESSQGKSVISSVGQLITGATASIVLNLSSALLQVYLGFLGAQKDKQLFYGVGSFEKQADALGVDREHVFTDNKFAKVTVEILGLH